MEDQSEVQKLKEQLEKITKENDQLKKDNASLQRVVSFPRTSTQRYSKRVVIKDLLKQGKEAIGQSVIVCGWAKTIRDQGVIFIDLNDGSSFKGLQIVLNKETPGADDVIGPNAGSGACFIVVGKVVESQGKNQIFEVLADEVELYGKCVQEKYPIAPTKNRLPLDFLRTVAHLRPRTNQFGAMARVRNACAMATHHFYQDQGFIYVHTPLITASDCEGAGEMFQVTSLLKNGTRSLADVPLNKTTGKPDYTQDFFGKPAFLTVSGQLNGEMYASAMGKIYTFGPTFRAEDSHTSRHAAEFWMIEPEVAFADLDDNMDLAEAYLKYCITYVTQHCADDIDFFDKFVSKGLKAKLADVLAQPFQRLSYTEAIDILLKVDPKKKKFEKQVSWGIDLGSEHERYLAEVIYKKPVILYNYPKDIKAFYMRLNDDGKTVRAMDVLVPGIGEVIGGSQREERLEVLEKRIEELALDKEAYKYYLDLRRFGTCPHSGFGLGFERLIMFVSGTENIRDTIPFPRYPGHADF